MVTPDPKPLFPNHKAAEIEILRLRKLLGVVRGQCAHCKRRDVEVFNDGETYICLDRESCAVVAFDVGVAEYEQHIRDLLRQINGSDGGVHDKLNEDREASGMWRVEVAAKPEASAARIGYFNISGTGREVLMALELIIYAHRAKRAEAERIAAEREREQRRIYETIAP